ncbi:TauD/TfdA family dioxygenase [Candidatus Kirkpatrickella diaphorinae]|uniref:TauD/TfdA family dioxygenase n=1 Tax=Candidatus Kirkpatrickella diaphorinae TaxID=2984322 RepID=A0ABY6GH86_9PROT|nr:TauD/TfdA family dioxygenase [Candidatus Kirkpatrickella diaphorinae]UYH50885.1 TauD/TfdA family dioxygenase [Candidatus Kirkpatrickella diaphorinae]
MANALGRPIWVPHQGQDEARRAQLTHLGLGDDPITGKGLLPFHTDGDRGEYKTRYLILYCLEASEDNQGGETLIASTENIAGILPADIYQILTQHDATTRFRLDAEGHFKSLTYRVYVPESASLMAYFPYPKSETPHWATIFSGFSAASSRDILTNMEEVLTKRSFCAHHWRKHDLLIIDNEKSIHARQPLTHGYRHVVRVICR